MTRPLITDPDVQAAIAALPDEPESGYDPRWVYDLSKEETYRAWPCAFETESEICRTRRDEHADQVEGAWPSYDLDDHPFTEIL